MKYKFKVGDKVRMKEGVDLGTVGLKAHNISGTAIIDNILLPDWCCEENKELNNAPTYVIKGWYVPESCLEEVN